MFNTYQHEMVAREQMRDRERMFQRKAVLIEVGRISGQQAAARQRVPLAAKIRLAIATMLLRLSA